MKNDEIKQNNKKKGTTNKDKNNKKVATKVTKIKEEKVIVEEFNLEDEVNETEAEVLEENKSSFFDKLKERKNDLFLLLGLVVVVVLGFFVLKGKDVGPTYELPLTLSGEAGLHELTYSEYQEKVDNDESFVVILESASCSHCVAFMPVAEKFANDNGLPMYYVDTNTFSSEDWDGFEKSNTYLKKANGRWGTPTTMVLAGNETVSYIEGETDAASLLNLYNEYFDMSEE